MARKATSIDSYPTETVYWMGKRHRIPVDDDGFVPVEALVRRYQQCGNSNTDRARDSKIVYSGRLRPRDVVRWWADPSSCDIRGIDTRKSDVYDVTGIKDKRMRAVQRRFAVVTDDPEEQRRIRRVIADSFTIDELDRMTRPPSFVIRTIPYGEAGDVVGFYERSAGMGDVPTITLEKGASADHITHEMVHHLRTTRKPGRVTSSAFPQKRDGTLDMRRYSHMSEETKRMIHDAEETATTVEAAVRTHIDRDPSGYWDYAGGRTAYERDKARLSQMCGGGDCTLKGADAVRAVQKKFNKLDIAYATILAKEPAKDCVEEVQRMNAMASTKKAPSKSTKPKSAPSKPASASGRSGSAAPRQSSGAKPKSKGQTRSAKGKGSK